MRRCECIGICGGGVPDTDADLEREPVIALEPGEIRLECEPKITAEEEASHVFRMLEIGCRLIAQSNPNNVNVTDVTDMGSPTYGQR